MSDLDWDNRGLYCVWSRQCVKGWCKHCSQVQVSTVSIKSAVFSQIQNSLYKACKYNYTKMGIIMTIKLFLILLINHIQLTCCCAIVCLVHFCPNWSFCSKICGKHLTMWKLVWFLNICIIINIISFWWLYIVKVQDLSADFD